MQHIQPYMDVCEKMKTQTTLNWWFQDLKMVFKFRLYKIKLLSEWQNKKKH